MNITLETAARLLGEYGISSEITGIGYYSDYSGADGIKIIARIDVKHRPPLVLKLLREAAHPHEQIERQCLFSEHLRRNGIPTPERYSKGGEYCLDRVVDGERVDVTLEDWCGEELTAIDRDTAAEAGKLMARIHRISFRDNFKIGAPTLFGALGRNDVSGLGKFREMYKKAEESRFKSVTYPHPLCTKLALFGEIIDIFEQKLANASAVWDRLPRGAVQGDISINNLTWRDGRLTVFDYNNAGDETLIGDMVLEGLLTAYESELAEGLTDSDRNSIFLSFLDGYRSICPLTHDERIAACELYPAYNALWFSRISSCEGRFPDSLEAVMERGDCERADELLSELYGLITADARKIFASELFDKERR